MTRIPLTLRFKGGRDYLQGPDLYNTICDQLPAAIQGTVVAPFRMIIHRFARHQCDLLVDAYELGSGRPEGLVVEFSCGTESGRISGWIVETDRAIEGRYPYDEGRVESGLVLDGERIMFNGDSGYSPVEVAVSMTKYLHNALYPTKHRWVFTRLDLDRFFRAEDSRSLTIGIVHCFKSRLTKSSMEVGGEVIGHIYFSRVES